jgi:signal transduction histidine kinase/DNA-binding response OmpR family regulator
MVLIGGGILYSGGTVFIGISGPLFASIFQNKRLAKLFLIFYLFTILIEAVLQPYLVPYPPMTPGINLFFFLAHFFTVVIVFFTALTYYANQTNKMKLAETIRLKELDDAKTKLYTNISHEFRTPLTIILGMADKIADNSNKKLDEGLQMIKRNGENLLHLINQMLDLSKIEAKAMPVYYFQGEIIGYLSYIFQSFSSLAKSKNIRLNIHTDIDQLIMDFDPDKLMQIISNLLSNAIKYTLEGGDIEMVIDKRQKNSVNELIIKVRDNGIGIPADKLSHIFDRFYKVDDDISGKLKGTGIGLALTKELVSILKGTINVQSEIASGTEFSIVLPVTNHSNVKHEIDFERFKSDISLFISDNLRKPIKASEDKRITKSLPKLIIVEDNQDVARYIESILSPKYTIQIATNGQEGLDLAIEIIPDIVISDVMMPAMNGFILCEKLKTDERTSHIPVILLTAMASDAKKLEGLEIGADAYLVKPFNTKELQIRVGKLIEQRRQLRERFSLDISLSPKEIAVTSVDERFLNRALEVIEKHMSDPDFGVDVFGKEVAMSHSHLHRKIHALTNQSPVELIRSIRLKRAASLLKQKYGNISEVAYVTGFNSPAYFSDCFQKQFGKSPSDFIAQV